MIKEVLEAIKADCAAHVYCKTCPFNISDDWHDYCLFTGDVPHEGTTPDDWKLDKISWNAESTCDTCKTPCIMYEKGMRGCKDDQRIK